MSSLFQYSMRRKLISFMKSNSWFPTKFFEPFPVFSSTRSSFFQVPVRNLQVTPWVIVKHRNTLFNKLLTVLVMKMKKLKRQVCLYYVCHIYIGKGAKNPNAGLVEGMTKAKIFFWRIWKCLPICLRWSENLIFSKQSQTRIFILLKKFWDPHT